MITAADGTAFTGAVTVAVTIDSGTQAAGSVGSAACAHEGGGYHSYRPAQAETNGAHIAFTFSGTGAIPATVQVFTRAGDAYTRLGAPAGASVSADIAAIEAQTDDIGVAGAGLTAVAWNAAWDAEVQSEVADALNAYDPPTNAEMEARTLVAASYATATAVDDLPTNAELATALGTADDAVLAAVAALNNLSAADVNAEVVDALNTDTYAEPGQGAPGATITLAAKIGYLYKAFRNRCTQTASEYALYADDGVTKDHEAAVSDDGTTLVRSEVTTGA